MYGKENQRLRDRYHDRLSKYTDYDSHSGYIHDLLKRHELKDRLYHVKHRGMDIRRSEDRVSTSRNLLLFRWLKLWSIITCFVLWVQSGTPVLLYSFNLYLFECFVNLHIYGFMDNYLCCKWSIGLLSFFNLSFWIINYRIKNERSFCPVPGNYKMFKWVQFKAGCFLSFCFCFVEVLSSFV